MYKNTSAKWEKNIYKNVQSVMNIYFDNVLINPSFITSFRPGNTLFNNDIELGSTPSQYIEMQIHKKANIQRPKNVRIEYGILINFALTVEEVNRMTVGDLSGIKVKSLSKDDSSFEMIPMGIYNVDDYDEEDDNVINIKLLDNMIKLDEDNGYYDASELINQKGYATLGEIAQDICNKKGLELATTIFLGSDKRVTVYDNSITARQYIGMIAEQAGCFACAGRDGKIYFRSIGEDEIEIPLRRFKTYKFGDEYKISKVAYEDGTRSFKFGDETRNTLWINQDNIFIVDEEQIQNIYNKLKDLDVYSFEGTTIIDPRIDMGDKIIIDGKPIIYQGEMNLSKRFIADIKSKISIKEKQETTIKKESQKSINRKIQSQIDQENLRISQLVQEQTETSKKLSEHEQTIEGFKDKVSSVEEKVETVESTAIVKVSVEYALGTNTTTAPTEGWDTTAPTWENGKYMWQRTILTYANGDKEISNATCIAGAKGKDGKDGINGTNGIDGEDGISIREIQEQYYLSTSNTEQTGGSWKTTQDTWSSGKYIWTRNKIDWSDNTTTYTEPVLATGINNANDVAESAKNTADEVDNNLKVNYYTREETNSQISQTSKDIMSEVNKKVNEDEIGTKIEQNYEHVKIAWNQISEFIQMMIINENASFAILDESKNIIMALDKTGLDFYETGQKFGEMGTEKDANNKFIAFSIDGEYDSTVNNGMAWGVKTKSDNKFHPIFYISDFFIPPKNSEGVIGDLILKSGRFILDSSNASLEIGGIAINGDDLDGVFFTANGEVLLQISKGNVIENPSINILNGVIRFYSNEAGTNSFKIGTDKDKNCLLDDEGYLYCNDLHVNTTGYFGGRIDCYNNINCTGNVYAKNISSDKRLKKNIKNAKNDALEKLNKIKIRSFDWKEDNNHVDYGLIAQEIEKINENYVLKQEIKNNNKEIIDYKYYINMLPVLATTIKAIQEQQEEIQKLQEKDKQKDEIIQNLLKRVEALEKEATK